MKKRNSLRKEICIWLETHDGEFTSVELAHLMGRDARRVSTELCFLRMEADSPIKITGQKDKYNIYQRCVPGTDVGEHYQKKKIETNIVLPPGVLGITTHTLDGGIERISA